MNKPGKFDPQAILARARELAEAESNSGIAEVAVTSRETQPSSGAAERQRETRPRPSTPWVAEDWLAFFDERAGILEFDGKHARLEAERLALAECAEHWRAMYPMLASAPESGCVHCSKGAGDVTLVPHLAAQRGVFWMHAACWPAFNAARNREARDALSRLLPDLPWGAA